MNPFVIIYRSNDKSNNKKYQHPEIECLSSTAKFIVHGPSKIIFIEAKDNNSNKITQLEIRPLSK
jgi:hypothetical protein